MAFGCGGYALFCVIWLMFAKWLALDSRSITEGIIRITIALLLVALFVRMRYRFSGVGYGILIGVLAWLLVLAGFGMLASIRCGVGRLGP
jgi:hypothetical protein